MRGSTYPELSNITTKAVLMEVYNQRYEDLDKMPVDDVLFLLRYYEAKKQYEKQLMEKEKNKNRRGRR